MQIAENDLRWRHVWWQLSLDDTAAFFDGLWFPIPKTEQVVSELRKVQLRWLRYEDEYLSDPGRGSNECMVAMQHSFSVEQLAMLVTWADKVFVHTASERLPEWLWSMLIAKVTKDEEERRELPTWVADFFVRIQSEKIHEKELMNERLNERFDLPLTSWDRSALVFRNSKRDSVRTTLSLTMQRNIFVKTWARATPDMEEASFIELHEIGKVLARKYSLDQQGWPFPGSWRFQLLPFAERWL